MLSTTTLNGPDFEYDGAVGCSASRSRSEGRRGRPDGGAGGVRSWGSGCVAERRIFEQEEPPTACPALTMRPRDAGAGHTSELFGLSDGEADGENLLCIEHDRNLPEGRSVHLNELASK